jgi:hypothetical protein
LPLEKVSVNPHWLNAARVIRLGCAMMVPKSAFRFWTAMHNL